MVTCRLPFECLSQLEQRRVPLSPKTLSALAAHCIAHVSPRAAPWKFAPGLLVEIDEGTKPNIAEKAMTTWAMAPQRDWSWLTTDGNGIQGWRSEQTELIAKCSALRADAIGCIEGGTGLGKTRVFASMAHDNSATHQILIAVPTLAVAGQWQLAWQEFSDVPIAEIWGRAQYATENSCEAEEQKLQNAAFETAASAPIIICTHHLVHKVLQRLERKVMLLVDEAHLAALALATNVGTFAPIKIFGPWLSRWRENNMPPGDTLSELELAGRLHHLVLRKMLPALSEEEMSDWRTSLVTREDGGAMVWARHGQSLDDALNSMWPLVHRAILFSGTMGWTAYCGARGLALMSRRLCIPPERLQDLGRVRPAWRDAQVSILLPQTHQSQDGRQWLGAYRDRKSVWWTEVAQVLANISRTEKTLVLLTSYADVEGIAKAMGNTMGVVTSTKGEPVSTGAAALALSTSWLWLATGAAWTGLDLHTPLQRVVIGSLPLPDPTAMVHMASTQNAVFDAVSRFRQGIGRLVRGPNTTGSSGATREIMLLDGRINDTSLSWRRICQPFLQVLGEDFDEHARFQFMKIANKQ